MEKDEPGGVDSITRDLANIGLSVEAQRASLSQMKSHLTFNKTVADLQEMVKGFPKGELPLLSSVPRRSGWDLHMLFLFYWLVSQINVTKALVMTSHFYRYWLGAVKHEAVTWARVHPYLQMDIYIFTNWFSV